MSRAIKFKNNDYLDSTSIVHNKKILSEILNDTGWIDMTLINNWRYIGSTYNTPQYRKIGNQVFIKGMITGGNNLSICCILPVNYRPTNIVYFGSSVSDDKAIIGIRVSQKGECLITNYLSTNSWLDIGMISFLTD